MPCPQLADLPAVQGPTFWLYTGSTYSSESPYRPLNSCSTIWPAVSSLHTFSSVNGSSGCVTVGVYGEPCRDHGHRSRALV